MGSKELNGDMISEVLSRSTLETVTRSRLVCKDIERLTHESHFKNQHSRITDTISGVFLQSMKFGNTTSSFVSTATNQNLKLKLTLNFLPDRHAVILACDRNSGIMLCVTYRPVLGGPALYMVCKPSTKQWCPIPNPKTRFYELGIGISVIRMKPLRFKIVWVSQAEPGEGCTEDGYRCLHWEVFDSDVWCWRILDDLCFPDGKHRSLLCDPAVSSCGRLHWHTYDGDVLTFCVETETVRISPQPEGVPSPIKGYGKFVKLVKYEGKLGLIHASDDRTCIDLWVLEDYNKRCWVLKRKIDLGSERGKNSCLTIDAFWPMAFCCSDVAVLLGFHQIILYNFETENVEIVEIEELGIREMFAFCTDMEELDFGRIHKRPTPWDLAKISLF